MKHIVKMIYLICLKQLSKKEGVNSDLIQLQLNEVMNQLANQNQGLHHGF